MTDDMPNLIPDQLHPVDPADYAAPGDPRHPPRILILTGSLRPVSYSRLCAEEGARVLRALFDQLRSSLGLSVLLVSHDLPLVARHATRLAIHSRLPVLTTVILVKKSGPRELAYREVLGGRVVHERRLPRPGR